MSALSFSPAAVFNAPKPSLGGDMRRHRRVHVQLSGRFMRADRNEYPCSLKNISVGGACVATSDLPEPGERVVVYFDNLGGFEAVVTRHTPDGFAMQFKISDYKREKLSSQLMWLVNRDSFPDELGRQHERHGTAGRKTTLRVENGVTIDVDLLDLSASGASIGTSARPAIGSLCLVGKVSAIVRRHHDKGLGVQFVTVQSENALKENFL